MLKPHVRQLLSAYVLGDLSAAETRLVAEHLLACQRCRQEYEEIKLGAEIASHLSPVSAPPDLWSEVAARLDQNARSVRQIQGSSARRTLASIFTQPRLAAVAAALLLALAYGLYLWLAPSSRLLVKNEPQPRPSPDSSEQIIAPPQPQTPLPATTPLRAERRRRPRTVAPRGLEVLSLDGAPVVESERIEARGRLGVGEWLETDEGSRAQINVAEIGEVQVDPNSRIGLLATSPTEHRLKLARGRMQASIYAPPRIFIVETPTATAVDLGCEYTLEVDESGASVLRVTSGYVSLEDPKRAVIVPAGAISETRRGRGPGTPYFENATPEFRRALAEFDATGDEEALLPVLLAEARRRDTLTLWHLLALVTPARRGAVYDRLVELYGPPPEVTREGVLRLDRAMLELYRKRLEWVW